MSVVEIEIGVPEDDGEPSDASEGNTINAIGKDDEDARDTFGGDANNGVDDVP